MNHHHHQPPLRCVIEDGKAGVPVKLPFRLRERPSDEPGQCQCVTHRVHPNGVLVCSVHKRFALLQ